MDASLSFTSDISKTVIAGVVGGLLTLLGQYALGQVQKPRINLRFGDEPPFLITAPHTRSPNGRAIWLRFRVENRGYSDALGVRAYMISAGREDGQKRELQLPFLSDDAVALWASAGGDASNVSALTISRGFGRFFDYGFVLGQNDLRLPSNAYHDNIGYPPGIYIYEVAVTGSNFSPVVRRVRVEFSGHDSPVKIEPID